MWLLVVIIDSVFMLITLLIPRDSSSVQKGVVAKFGGNEAIYDGAEKREISIRRVRSMFIGKRNQVVQP